MPDSPSEHNGAGLDKAKGDVAELRAETTIANEEVKPDLKQIGMSDGKAGGGIAESTELTGNPYLTAVGGTTIAIKSWSDQQEKLRAKMEKSIATTREMHEGFDENFADAIRHVNESLAEFHRSLARVGDVQNEFAAQLSRQTALIHEQAAAVTALAQARLGLAPANIQGAEVSGEVSSPEGSAADERTQRQSPAVDPAATLADAIQRVNSIESHARSDEGGHVSREEYDQLRALNDRILGLLENRNLPAGQQGGIENLVRRVEALESTNRDHAQILGQTGNVNP